MPTYQPHIYNARYFFRLKVRRRAKKRSNTNAANFQFTAQNYSFRISFGWMENGGAIFGYVHSIVGTHTQCLTFRLTLKPRYSAALNVLLSRGTCLSFSLFFWRIKQEIQTVKKIKRSNKTMAHEWNVHSRHVYSNSLISPCLHSYDTICPCPACLSCLMHNHSSCLSSSKLGTGMSKWRRVVPSAFLLHFHQRRRSSHILCFINRYFMWNSYIHFSKWIFRCLFSVEHIRIIPYYHHAHDGTIY